MKKLIALSLIFFTAGNIALAQTKTPSPTIERESTSSAETKDIRDLKEKLEDKVEELQQSNKKAVSGIITAISANTIRIQSEEGTQYQVKTDEVLTKFYTISGTSKKEIALDGLEKGDYIIAAGPLGDNTVTANYIYVDQQYIVGSGNITEVNSSDFFIKVVNTVKDTIIIDIQSKSTQNLLDIKTNETEKIGFSKIKEGDTIHYVLIKTGKEREKNRYDALRTLIIPQEFFIK